MKFYFCEGCGKRITEKDISGGQARDKKLKGVYCATCAEGVMTMENIALTDESAKQLLQTQAPAAPQSDSERIQTAASTATMPTASRHSSSNKIPPARRSVTRSRESNAAGHHPRPAEKRNNLPIILASVGGVLLAIGGLTLMLSGSGEPTTNAAKKPPAKVPQAIATAPSVQPPSQPKPVPPVPEPTIEPEGEPSQDAPVVEPATNPEPPVEAAPDPAPAATEPLVPVKVAEDGGTLTLVVDFGPKKGGDTYGLVGWNTTIVDRYTVHIADGPGGTTCGISDSDPSYNYQGVTSQTPRVFKAGESIIITWYNNSDDKSLEFAPHITFKEPNRRTSGSNNWVKLDKVSLAPRETGTSTFTFTDTTAGAYSTINVNNNVARVVAKKLICDKIELLTPSLDSVARIAPFDPAKHQRWAPGLKATYFDDLTFTKAVGTEVVTKLDMTFPEGPLPGMPADNWSARWEGKLRILKEGAYNFYANVDDLTKHMRFDGKVMVKEGRFGPSQKGSTFNLKPGDYDLRIDFSETGGGGAMQLYWEGPGFSKSIVPAEHFIHDASTTQVRLSLNDPPAVLPIEQAVALADLSPLDRALKLAEANGGQLFLTDLPLKALETWHTSHKRDSKIPLAFAGQPLAHALMTHPHDKEPAFATYALGGRFAMMTGACGINDSVETNTSSPLVFKIQGDGKDLWTSTPLTQRGDKATYSVDTAGIQELKLVVTAQGGAGMGHAIWIDPLLLQKKLPEPHETAMAKHLDKLRAALEDADPEEMKDAAAAMAGDATLGPWQAATQELPQAAAALVAEATYRQTALERLVGKDVRLKLPGYTAPKEVKVTGVEDDKLKAQISFSIGGQKGWAERAWPLDDLDEAFWISVKQAHPPEPHPGAKLLAALRAWAGDDNVTAREAIGALGAHPMKDHLLNSLEMSSTGNARQEKLPGGRQPHAAGDGQKIPGLITHYFDRTNMDFSQPFDLSTAKGQNITHTIDNNWDYAGPGFQIGGNNFGVRWEGFLHVEKATTAAFIAFYDDHMRVRINGIAVPLNRTGSNNEDPPIASLKTVPLPAGDLSLIVEFQEDLHKSRCHLYWQCTGMTKREIIPASAYFHRPIKKDEAPEDPTGADATPVNSTNVGEVPALATALVDLTQFKRLDMYEVNVKRSITIKKKRYGKSVLLRPSSKTNNQSGIEYTLPPPGYRTLVAHFGHQAGSDSDCVVTVSGDGKKLWTTTVTMAGGIVTCKVDVTGVTKLTIEAVSTAKKHFAMGLLNGYLLPISKDDGSSVPASLPPTAAAPDNDGATNLQPGLLARYYTRKDKSFSDPFEASDLKYEETVSNIDFNVRSGRPVSAKKAQINVNVDYFGISWMGILRIERPATVAFYAKYDDHLRLRINGVEVPVHKIAKPDEPVASPKTVQLPAGDLLFEAEYQEDVGHANATLFWQRTGMTEREVVPASVFFHKPESK